MTTPVSRAMALALLAGTLAGCQVGASDALSLKSKDDPVELMVSIGRTAQNCWFRSKDAMFTGYRMADETHSPAGRPRILLVPRNDPAGLPKLVIQAETKGSEASGTYTDVQTYGPALGTPAGKRIASDVTRWAAGSTDCS